MRALKFVFMLHILPVGLLPFEHGVRDNLGFLKRNGQANDFQRYSLTARAYMNFDEWIPVKGVVLKGNVEAGFINSDNSLVFENFYLGGFNSNGDNWQLYRCVTGGFTLLGSYADLDSNGRTRTARSAPRGRRAPPRPSPRPAPGSGAPWRSPACGRGQACWVASPATSVLSVAEAVSSSF